MTRIAILDPFNHVMCYMDNDVEKAIHYYDDVLHTYLAGSQYTFSFSVDLEHEDTKYIVEGNKLSFLYKGKGYYLTIVRAHKDDGILEVESYGLVLELIGEEALEYKPKKAMTFVEYMNEMKLSSEIIKINLNEIEDKKITNEWTGSESKLSRIYSLATVFESEVEFITNLNYDYSLKDITLNIYAEHSDKNQGIGTDRRNEILRYERDIDGISKESDITELYTAIQPKGKGSLTLASLKADNKDLTGNEVLDENGNIMYWHPKGSKIIYAVQSKDLFPAILSGSNDLYITNYNYSFDTSNVNTLYGESLAELKKHCVPKVTYEVRTFIDADIGDTFTIDDVEYREHLFLEARIVEQEICFTDYTQSKTKFDNFTELRSKISNTLNERVIKLREEMDDVRVSVDGIEDIKITAEEAAKKATNFIKVVDKQNIETEEVIDSAIMISDNRKEVSNNNILIDDKSVNIRQGTDVLATFDKNGMQVNMTYTSPWAVEEGRTDLFPLINVKGNVFETKEGRLSAVGYLSAGYMPLCIEAGTIKLLSHNGGDIVFSGTTYLYAGFSVNADWNNDLNNITPNRFNRDMYSGESHYFCVICRYIGSGVMMSQNYPAYEDGILFVIPSDKNGFVQMFISDSLDIYIRKYAYSYGFCPWKRRPNESDINELSNRISLLESYIKPLKITKQPQDVECSIGDTVQFSVEATGNGLIYQWQESTYGWKNIPNANGPTLTIIADETYYDGTTFRCVITDVYGNRENTSPAFLYNGYIEEIG